ncbi:GntR family transcriptional regulator [Clostridioides sp. ES-S-0077-01]|uniref:GntR family transcriptional regulator n=1 Tax=unclassified Clostridioides TaxID=2635829 RepID=UPI001D1258F1|nr:GntR family transcriptional regulator [Clostridioides sp. ES-S-0171-01]MCC0688545.1 GntR family transcriptional regulator [Clostridioides sp. ES-S-0056-01]MCC0713595.1 GntR family transcriptional regulator [Clostridioides sp. ES-S-0077-01]UDN56377.1 GntR family transcriptional regulator [Clostridioides sp. ES-S-0054-01]
MKVDPLTTQVYDYISKKIQNGEYEANRRITESEICKSIGVSRTPAREALTRLAGENLLEKIPNKGFVVKEFQEREKLDTYSVIGVLDGLAGSSALQNLTESDLTKMEELTEMMTVSIKYKNYNNYLKLSNEFHDMYITKSDNQVLINLLNSLRYNFMSKSYTSDNENALYKMLEYSNNQHIEVVKFMRENDLVNVERILKEHWKTIPISDME